MYVSMYVYTKETVHRLTSLKSTQWFSNGNILQETDVIAHDVGISKRYK